MRGTTRTCGTRTRHTRACGAHDSDRDGVADNATAAGRRENRRVERDLK